MLGDLANFPVAFTGEAWGVEPLPDAFRTPVVSDVPILLVSGTLDANTPPENAEEVLAGLRCGDHLVVDGMAHDYFMRFRRGDGHPVELVPTRRDRDPRGDETGAVHADGQAGADEVAVLTDGLAVGVVVPDKRAAANAS